MISLLIAACAYFGAHVAAWGVPWLWWLPEAVGVAVIATLVHLALLRRRRRDAEPWRQYSWIERRGL